MGMIQDTWNQMRSDDKAELVRGYSRCSGLVALAFVGAVEALGFISSGYDVWRNHMLPSESQEIVRRVQDSPWYMEFLFQGLELPHRINAGHAKSESPRHTIPVRDSSKFVLASYTPIGFDVAWHDQA